MVLLPVAYRPALRLILCCWHSPSLLRRGLYALLVVSKDCGTLVQLNCRPPTASSRARSSFSVLMLPTARAPLQPHEISSLLLHLVPSLLNPSNFAIELESKLYAKEVQSAAP
jgi:hypothetical protein